MKLFLDPKSSKQHIVAMQCLGNQYGDSNIVAHEHTAMIGEATMTIDIEACVNCDQYKIGHLGCPVVHQF